MRTRLLAPWLLVFTSVFVAAALVTPAFGQHAPPLMQPSYAMIVPWNWTKVPSATAVARISAPSAQWKQRPTIDVRELAMDPGSNLGDFVSSYFIPRIIAADPLLKARPPFATTMCGGTAPAQAFLYYEHAQYGSPVQGVYMVARFGRKVIIERYRRAEDGPNESGTDAQAMTAMRSFCKSHPFDNV